MDSVALHKIQKVIVQHSLKTFCITNALDGLEYDVSRENHNGNHYSSCDDNNSNSKNDDSKNSVWWNVQYLKYL